MNLYRFFADYGRMGDVEGLFLATEEQIQRACDHRMARFGEILGKHSDVQIDLKSDMFELISTDQEKIEWLRVVLKDQFPGYNPLDYTYDECSTCHERACLSELFDSECSDCRITSDQVIFDPTS